MARHSDDSAHKAKAPPFGRALLGIELKRLNYFDLFAIRFLLAGLAVVRRPFLVRRTLVLPLPLIPRGILSLHVSWPRSLLFRALLEMNKSNVNDLQVLARSLLPVLLSSLLVPSDTASIWQNRNGAVTYHPVEALRSRQRRCSLGQRWQTQTFYGCFVMIASCQNPGHIAAAGIFL